jgi:hypothetical protein
MTHDPGESRRRELDARTSVRARRPQREQGSRAGCPTSGVRRKGILPTGLRSHRSLPSAAYPAFYPQLGWSTMWGKPADGACRSAAQYTGRRDYHKPSGRGESRQGILRWRRGEHAALHHVWLAHCPTDTRTKPGNGSQAHEFSGDSRKKSARQAMPGGWPLTPRAGPACERRERPRSGRETERSPEIDFCLHAEGDAWFVPLLFGARFSSALTSSRVWRRSLSCAGSRRLYQELMTRP